MFLTFASLDLQSILSNNAKFCYDNFKNDEVIDI